MRKVVAILVCVLIMETGVQAQKGKAPPKRYGIEADLEDYPQYAEQQPLDHIPNDPDDHQRYQD